jgi:FkbM family methyltransferase
MHSYSQCQEDRFIVEYFKDVRGNFLDIGADDGVSCSNTLALLELGWTGTCMEPSPEAFRRMTRNYVERTLLDRAQLLNAALVPDYFRGGDLEFHDLQLPDGFIFTGYGTFSGTHALETLSKPKFQRGRLVTSAVKTLRRRDFFATHGDVWDFIDIDVEWLNYELLLSTPWKSLRRLKLLCIEQDCERARYENFMQHMNMHLVEIIDNNLFFAPLEQ